VKTRDCLSDGQFCAFFPKTEEIDVKRADMEDYIFEDKDSIEREKKHEQKRSNWESRHPGQKKWEELT